MKETWIHHYIPNWNSSGNNKLDEENRLRNWQKHSICCEGDGVSFLGGERNPPS